MIRFRRRQLLQFAAAAVAAPALPQSAPALDYPTRPLRWIVGFPPGGGADTVSRIMAQWLSERLGQSIVVENKPGAATNISIQAAVSAPPDGYTLLFIAASATVNVTLFDSLPFNLLRDIAPASGLIDFPLVLVVNPSTPARTVAEFIAYARDNPGKISMASFGTGSTSHVAGELFQTMTGIRMVHVPYRGRSAGADRHDRRPGAGDATDLDRIAPAHPIGCIAPAGSGGEKPERIRARSADHRRDSARIRGEFLVRGRCAARHPGRDHHQAQSGDQCRPCRPGHPGASRRRGDDADFPHAGKLWRLYGERGREVGQGHQGVGREAGVMIFETCLPGPQI